MPTMAPSSRTSTAVPPTAGLSCNSCDADDVGMTTAEPLEPLDDLQLKMLKQLHAVGSNGILKQQLYNRLPPRSTAARIRALNDLRERGLVTMAKTARHTSRWAQLWTITDAGKDVHRALMTAVASAAGAAASAVSRAPIVRTA